MNEKIKTILNKIKKKPYEFTAFFIGYLTLNALLNKTHITVPKIFYSFDLWFASSFVLLNVIIIPTLVALTLTFSIEKIKDLKNVPKKGTIPILATFATLLGGACPGCFVGLFPAFIGLFGVTANLGILPLYGFEIQLFSTIILIISLNYLTRITVCKLSIPKQAL